MYLRSEEERRPMSPKLALRVAVISGIALIGFAVIFLRLWYLEVLSGEEYRAQADNNRVRELKIAAPRGEIVDRDGEVLVTNRTALALQVRPDRLPDRAKARNRVLGGLAETSGLGLETVKKRIRRSVRELPASPVTIKRDVPYSLVYYFQERAAEFPGVSVERVFVRNYPHGTLGAHLFGYVSEVNAEQLSQPQYADLEQGARVGQTGIENTYDDVLRGRDGAQRIQVDALGRPRGRQLSEVRPRPGNNLVLTIDSDVQNAGESALRSYGLPGGFVAMDVRDGAIYGLGSNPTFDPSVYTRPRIPQSVIDQLYSEANEAPQANRAIQGLYPTGSTFKLITSVAALEEDLIEPDSVLYDGGTIEVGGITFKNAGDPPPSFGSIQVPRALQVSSDVFYYQLGMLAERSGEQPIQHWASELGLGAPTGIDLPAEGGGLIPTPEWRNELYDEGATDRPWSIGDSINLSVGQGDLQANPLQMAVAYAAVGNGGDIVRPHLADSVEDGAGRKLQEIRPAPRRQVEIDPENRAVIMDGLRRAAMEPGGTSYGIFGGWPVQIAGKTGTAERGIGRADQSWYVAMAPANNPEVVVAVTIERGGFGAEAAAPAAAQILREYFGITDKQLRQTAETTDTATVAE